ncbi:glycoside hydrolase family 16 protein [Cucurbitaria berberidis CBS 394.84]|uniref:Glycoside hydrolase family 16 protein n=1 Tax=Cucurbitaria berberidis CBS 394.84 TaxID=1168544 RepID=A0A9P4GKJ0_9PLEO|nr:glycoside hydrolase family 16 protein [Cucurbitaria berberidis CBS 394.84]KAF1847124.1 glycoside hydrolase family 16 protein [Cucurbitaria berberidis CBS 394.84]
MSRFSNAACECGYSLNKTSDASYAVFTELLENDFLHTSTKNLSEVGWAPQVYNVSSKNARGPFGKNMELGNVVTNPLKNRAAWSGQSEHGGDAGLELWVRGDHQDGFVSGAEIVTHRNDMLLGSYRVGMKMSNSSGTCGAFFFYHNNSQEIDMEFLSHQFNESQGTVNLVMQSPESVTHGYDASGTSAFQVQRLPFRPDENFHEYRFDWTKDRVAFYVDSVFLYDMKQNMPTEGGAMFFNHWSNGDPSWSAGPPDSDTVMTISYMKAYFNSTDTERSQNAYRRRCPVYDPTKVCAIPAQNIHPDPSVGKNAAKTYFFSTESDMAPGQAVYHGAAAVFSAPVLSIVVPGLVALSSGKFNRVRSVFKF